MASDSCCAAVLSPRVSLAVFIAPSVSVSGAMQNVMTATATAAARDIFNCSVFIESNASGISVPSFVHIRKYLLLRH